MTADLVFKTPSAVLTSLQLAGPALGLPAILFSHARRILIPRLYLRFLFPRAMDGMKLSRSTPYYFVEESMRLGWGEAAFWMGMMGVWGTVWEMLEGRLMGGAREGVKVGLQGEKRVDDGRQKRREHASVSLMRDEVVLDVCRVVDVVLGLAWLECLYTGTCWSISHLHALYALLLPFSPSPSSEYRSFFYRLAALHPGMLSAQTLFALWWLLRIVIMRGELWTVAEGAWSRKTGQIWWRALVLVMGYGVVAAGTVHLVRYSNKYFVLLEMSDLVVTFGWIGLGVGSWAVDKLGLMG